MVRYLWQFRFKCTLFEISDYTQGKTKNQEEPYIESYSQTPIIRRPAAVVRNWSVLVEVLRRRSEAQWHL